MRRIEISATELGILAGMVRKIDFFAPLTVGQLEQVLPHVMLCSYAAGETVFRQGDPGDAFHIIYKGKVDVLLKRLVFFAKKVASLGSGHFFGEIALTSDEPRSATVVCAEPTLLFTLIAADVAFILRENPAAAAQLKSIAAQRKFVSEHSS